MIVETLSLIAAFCYTLSGILALLGMKKSNPNTATFVSMVANMAFLWPIALLFSPVTFSNRAILLYAVSAAFAPLAGRMLNYISLERMGVSTTTSISGLQPIMVAVLASVFVGEKLPATIYAAIAITTIGITVIGRSSSAPNSAKAFKKWELIIPLSSTFGYSSSNVLRKEGLKEQNLPLIASVVTCSFSALYMFGLLVFTRRLRQMMVTRSSLLFFFLSGLVNSFAWITSFQALSIGEASIVSTILGTQPLLAIVLSHFLLRRTEKITKGKIAGASLVAFGVAVITILK